MHRPGDGVATRGAPLSRCGKREGRVVERLARRRIVTGRPVAFGAHVAGDARAGGRRPHAADRWSQRRARCATVMLLVKVQSLISLPFQPLIRPAPRAATRRRCCTAN